MAEHLALDEVTRRWGRFEGQDPFPLYAALRDRGPVHEVTLADGHRAFLVVGYEEARAALNDPRLSKDMQAALAQDPSIVAEGLPGPELSRHVVNVDPPDHTRLRRAVATPFTHRRVEELRPFVEQLAEELLDTADQAAGSAAIDLMESFAFPLPFTVICELLGVPSGQRSELGDHLTTLLGPTPGAQSLERARTSSAVVVQVLTDLVDSKRRHPADDLTSDLVRASTDGDGMSSAEVLSSVFNLIVAGHETTTNLIGNAALTLALDHELRAALVADPDRIPGFVEEQIRHDGPVHHATFRYAVTDLELGGVTIPAGAQVLIGLAAANRDQRRYREPDRLDIEREGPRHLGFGHGIHHCLGAGLARMEATTAIGTLLARSPHIRLAVPFEQLEWGRGDGVVLRGLTNLPVHLDPSSSA